MLTSSLLALILIAPPPVTAELRQAPIANTKEAVAFPCQVVLIDDVEVPALETGQLVTINVREGQFVKLGDLLAQMDDRQAQLLKQSSEAERAAAQTKADDDIDVRYATKSFELAEAELNQDLQIKRTTPGAVTDADIRRKQLLRMREQLGIERAIKDRSVQGFTAQSKAAAVLTAEEMILRRKIVAPFDGQVLEVEREASEWVNAGEPVLRIVRMDRLRIDGFLNGDEFNPTDVARRPVTVDIELARGRRERFSGEVVFVDPLVRAGNKYRVRADVQNRMERDEPLLRPGMTARMTIHLQ